MSGVTGASSGDPAVTGAAWSQPQPQAVLGLSSSMIYGSAFSSSIPSSLQLATGGQVKLCIDPVGIAKSTIEGLSSLPNPEDVFLGPGINGNVQLTIGSSANILLGQAFNIHLGPKGVEPHFGSGLNSVLAGLVGALIGVSSVIFQIAYGLRTDDNKRANLVVIFQMLFQSLLGALITIGNLQAAMEETKATTICEMYEKKKVGGPKELASLIMLGASAIGLFELVGMPIIVSDGEDKLSELVAGKQKDAPGEYVSASSQNNP